MKVDTGYIAEIPDAHGRGRAVGILCCKGACDDRDREDILLRACPTFTSRRQFSDILQTTNDLIGTGLE